MREDSPTIRNEKRMISRLYFIQKMDLNRKSKGLKRNPRTILSYFVIFAIRKASWNKKCKEKAKT